MRGRSRLCSARPPRTTGAAHRKRAPRGCPPPRSAASLAAACARTPAASSAAPEALHEPEPAGEPEPVREQEPVYEPEPELVPSPQERLRHVFSADIPENFMERSATLTPASEPAADVYARSDRVADAFAAPRAVGGPVLRVVGVGGAGVNAVNRMVEAEIEGVEFLAINTDLQSLQQSRGRRDAAHRRRGHPRSRLRRRTRISAARPRARSTTGSRRCCAARTWSSSPPARAAAPAPARRRWSRRSRASSARSRSASSRARSSSRARAAATRPRPGSRRSPKRSTR